MKVSFNPLWEVYEFVEKIGKGKGALPNVLVTFSKLATPVMQFRVTNQEVFEVSIVKFKKSYFYNFTLIFHVMYAKLSPLKLCLMVKNNYTSHKIIGNENNVGFIHLRSTDVYGWFLTFHKEANSSL